MLGLLGALAWPKLAELTRKGTEGGTRGNLGAIRAALSIYYGDMEGLYPADPASLTIAQKYLASVPEAKTPRHHWSSARVRAGAAPDDAGGWIYNNAPADPSFGAIRVNCTHTDVIGTVWATY